MKSHNIASNKSKMPSLPCNLPNTKSPFASLVSLCVFWGEKNF